MLLESGAGRPLDNCNLMAMLERFNSPSLLLAPTTVATALLLLRSNNLYNIDNAYGNVVVLMKAFEIEGPASVCVTHAERKQKEESPFTAS